MAKRGEQTTRVVRPTVAPSREPLVASVQVAEPPSHPESRQLALLPPPPPMLVEKVALVDANGVLTGFTDDLAADGVRVPVECDLEPGKYRFTGHVWAPILQRFNKNRIDDPKTVIMLGVLIADLKAAGVPLSDYVLAWLEHWQRSIDNPSTPTQKPKE